ncbi:MAG: hypothetical protein AAGE59_19545 [Cyanobacteria bacterium P01_F01_bin.86]
MFTKLSTDEAASALLKFGDRCLESITGDVPGQQFLETFQSVSIAKILLAVASPY